MTPKARREHDRQELRSKILDAARSLFVADGYEAVTMRKVAERVAYTPTALYTHFADKDALLRELCDADFRALREAFGQTLRTADPVERIARIGRAYADFALANPFHYRLMFMTPLPANRPSAGKAAERGNPAEDAYAFLRATVAEALASGRFRPEYPDAELVAQVFWSALHGVLALHFTLGDDPWVNWTPVADRVQAVIDGTLRGLTARGA